MRLSAAEREYLRLKKIKRLKDKLKGMKRMMRNINRRLRWCFCSLQS